MEKLRKQEARSRRPEEQRNRRHTRNYSIRPTRRQSGLKAMKTRVRWVNHKNATEK